MHRNGLHQLLDDALVWLDLEVGRADHAKHAAMTLGGTSVAFHFRDVEPARRFLEAFPGLTLADGTVTAAYTSPALPHGGDRRPS